MPTLLYVGCDDRDTRVDLAFLPPECEEPARVDGIAGACDFLFEADPAPDYLVAYGADIAAGYQAVNSPASNTGAGTAIVLVHGCPTAAVQRGAAALGVPIVSLPRDWDVLLFRLGANPAAVSAAVQGGAS
jgi:hypothetical protein